MCLHLHVLYIDIILYTCIFMAELFGHTCTAESMTLQHGKLWKFSHT